MSHEHERGKQKFSAEAIMDLLHHLPSLRVA
jgi:hypothetical protein